MANIPKGLESLLGKKTNLDGTEHITYFHPADLKPNPFQPRKDFPKESLQELADSIKTSGMLLPLIATRRDANIVLVSGERRLRAAQLAGLDKVPVILRDVADRDMLITALLENLHREDLNVVEEAQAYRRLVAEFKIAHNSLAELVSKSRSHISNTIRLLELPKSVLDLLAQNFITANHARILLTLEDARVQEAMAQRIVKERLTVRQLEDMVKELHPEPSVRKSTTVHTTGSYRTLAQEISAKIGRRIWIRAAGKPGHEHGRVIIEFNTPQEFALLTRIITTQYKV